MNYHQDCPCCRHRTTAYTLPFNRGLARGFLKFADAYLASGGKPQDKGSLKLTNSEYGNFQNLRHYGLVVQEAKGKGWILTTRGEAFLCGKIKLLSPVAHFGGETLPDDHLAWATHDGARTEVSLAEVLPAEWKARQEYVAEKRDLVA